MASIRACTSVVFITTFMDFYNLRNSTNVCTTYTWVRFNLLLYICFCNVSICWYFYVRIFLVFTMEISTLKSVLSCHKTRRSALRRFLSYRHSFYDYNPKSYIIIKLNEITYNVAKNHIIASSS